MFVEHLCVWHLVQANKQSQLYNLLTVTTLWYAVVQRCNSEHCDLAP